MSMRRSPKLRPAPWDLAVIFTVLAFALACGALVWGGGTEGLTAVVSVDGVEIDRFALNGSAGERVYSANGYALTAAVSPDGVQITASDCPTQDCVRMGTIFRSGQSIVCLPARFILRLEGERETNSTGVDAVIG